MPDYGSVKAKTAIDWYKGGMSIIELATVHGVTTYIATKFLKENEVKLRPRGRPPTVRITHTQGK